MSYYRYRSSSLYTHSVRKRQPPRRPQPAENDQQRQRELEDELRTARDIQQGLLLEAVPALPGWDISAVSLPARDLGGDLYDFLPLGPGKYGVMVGDVSGKGLPAALRMAVARTVFRHEARRIAPPAETLAAVNQGVLVEIPHAMVTMAYAAIDLHTGAMQIANAGHPFPVLMSKRIGELDVVGVPLGIDSQCVYDEHTVTLAPGDSIVFYSDGVIELLDDAEEIFTYERLEESLTRNRHLPPRSLVARLLADLRHWNVSQSDDITIVALRRRLAVLGEELAFVAADVLGGALNWEELPLPATNAPASIWLAHLPEIIAITRQRAGRALARELQSQLRMVLDAYRTDDPRPDARSETT